VFLSNDKGNRKKFEKESFLTVNNRPMRVKDKCLETSYVYLLIMNKKLTYLIGILKKYIYIILFMFIKCCSSK